VARLEQVAPPGRPARGLIAKGMAAGTATLPCCSTCMTGNSICGASRSIAHSIADKLALADKLELGNLPVNPAAARCATQD
jgi:hypothetical protein